MLRKAPALEAKRSARAARARVKVTQEKEREKRDEAAYYEVHGVDTRAELRRLWQLPIGVEYRQTLPPHRRNRSPPITVRNRVAGAGTYGVAFTSQHRILINRIQGQDMMVVCDTLCHELAHILTPTHGHDRVWKHVYRVLFEQAWAIKSAPVKNRFVSLHKKLVKSEEDQTAPGDVAGDLEHGALDDGAPHEEDTVCTDQD